MAKKKPCSDCEQLSECPTCGTKIREVQVPASVTWQPWPYPWNPTVTVPTGTFNWTYQPGPYTILYPQANVAAGVYPITLDSNTFFANDSSIEEIDNGKQENALQLEAGEAGREAS